MVRSCPGDTGGLLGRLDMAFWRQKLMKNTSNLLYRYKKRAQDEVLTTCIALQLGGGWGASGVGHEIQGAATKDQNFNIFKCSNCTDEVDFTQNLCLCLLAPLEFKSASEKFPLPSKGFIPAHAASWTGGRNNSFWGVNPGHCMFRFGTFNPVFPSAMQFSRDDLKGSWLTIFLSEFKGDCNFHLKLTFTSFLTCFHSLGTIYKPHMLHRSTNCPENRRFLQN